MNEYLVDWNEERAWELIPSHMIDGLKGYISDGMPPGSFLMAVLCNDLKEAVGRADDVNIIRIPEYVKFLYNYAPQGCWGSVEKVRAWIQMHEVRRGEANEVS